MSQRDILDYMKENGGKATIPELVDALGISRGSINEQLLKLRHNWGKVEKVEDATGLCGDVAVFEFVGCKR